MKNLPELRPATTVRDRWDGTDIVIIVTTVQNYTFGGVTPKAIGGVQQHIEVKRMPRKGLYGKELPFADYSTLIMQVAHTEQKQTRT